MSQAWDTTFTDCIAPPLDGGEDYHAVWSPIYIEPIVYSGERLTAGFVFKGEDGEIKLINVLADATVKELFGKKADTLNSLAQMALTDAGNFLLNHPNLTDWTPELSGVFPGRNISSADNNLDNIIKQAKQNFSFLAAASLKKPKQQDQEDKTTKALVKKLRDKVGATREGLKNNFNRPVSFIKDKGDKKSTIGYVGNHIALNFSSLDPRSTSFAVQQSMISKKVLELSSIRKLDMADFHRLEVCVWQPDKSLLKKRELTRLREAETELEFMGDSVQVIVHPYNQEDIASPTKIILQDAM